LTALAAPGRSLEELKREFVERALRGEELFFKLFEHANRLFALESMTQPFEGWRVKLHVPASPYTTVHLETPDGNEAWLTTESTPDLVKMGVKARVGGVEREVVVELNDAGFSEVFELLELDRETGILGKLREALVELGKRAERGILEWRRERRGQDEVYTAVLVTSDGSELKVETEDVSAFKRLYHEIVTSFTLLDALSVAVKNSEDAARRAVAPKIEEILRAADESLDRFYDSVDWDRTGENVVRRAEELAEEVLRGDGERGEALAEIVGEKVAETFNRLESWGVWRLKRTEIPDIRVRDVAKRITATLAGTEPPLTETAQGNIAVFRFGWVFSLAFERGETVSSLFIVYEKDGKLYFDVEGLIALSYLEDRFKLVSKLVEEMERRERELVDKIPRAVAAVKYYEILFNEEPPYIPPFLLP
jgi:hypothetical protein